MVCLYRSGSVAAGNDCCVGVVLNYKTLKYTTTAVRSNILSILIFASCVRYSDRAYCWVCVLIKGIGRRLPLELQCSYQGQ